MQRDLIYAQSGNDPSRVLVPKLVIEIFDRFRQTNIEHLEAGGLLLGLRRGPHIEILTCTSPMPKDKRTRSSFLRRDPGHFQIAQRDWRKSGGEIGYVGEWHTHPEAQPSPSTIDTREWASILKLEQRQTVFVIVGTAHRLVARGALSEVCKFSSNVNWEPLKLLVD